MPQAQKPRPKKPPKKMVPRLPPGSRKIHFWTGTQWQGELTVLDAPTFRSFDSSEQRSLWALDAMYRQWLEAQPAEVKAKHAKHLAR